PMAERLPGPMPPEVERGFGSRVLAANHNHVVVEVWVRLAIVVEDFGQIFAGHADCIWEFVIAGRDNNLSGAAVMDVSLAIGGGNVKTSVFAIDGLHPVVLVDLQIVVLCGSAVVLKSFLAVGLDE